jgi:meiotically up-regulated gene 157 (Mug157) protein
LRFDTPIYFQRIIPGEYQPDTGDYSPDSVAEVKRYASITSPGTETLTLLYGTLKQDALTIRLQVPYTEAFDRIRIGEGVNAKTYRIDRSRQLRSKQTFIVSEVQ